MSRPPGRMRGRFAVLCEAPEQAPASGDLIIVLADRPVPRRRRTERDSAELLRLAREEGGAALGRLLELYRGELTRRVRARIGRRLQSKLAAVLGSLDFLEHRR